MNLPYSMTSKQLLASQPAYLPARIEQQQVAVASTQNVLAYCTRFSGLHELVSRPLSLTCRFKVGCASFVCLPVCRPRKPVATTTSFCSVKWLSRAIRVSSMVSSCLVIPIVLCLCDSSAADRWNAIFYLSIYVSTQTASERDDIQAIDREAQKCGKSLVITCIRSLDCC